MKKSYEGGTQNANTNQAGMYENQTVQEKHLEHPKQIIENRNEIGTKATIKRLAKNIHERGIRQAGERSLPLYGLGAFFAFMILMAMGEALLESVPIIGVFVTLFVLLLFLALWGITPFLIYWDCKAAERYLGQKWYLGKLIALSSIVLSPIALAFQLGYRIRKM